MKPHFMLVTLVLSSFAIASGQITDPDYRLLGTFSVVRRAITGGTFGQQWQDSISLAEHVRWAQHPTGESHLRYEVERLWEYEKYELVRVIDKTNWGIHEAPTDNFIIDRSSHTYWKQYHEVGPETIEDFISKTFCQDDPIGDTVFSVLIELYNQVSFTEGEGVYETTQLMHTTRDSAFLLLKSEIGLASMFHTDRNRKSVSQYRAFRRCWNPDGRCRYWILHYQYAPGRFWVSRHMVMTTPQAKMP